MRTLVISDLHIGSRLGRDVLRRGAALDALLCALDDVDRLVLLGDVVELAEGRAARAMEIAGPVLRAVGARMGAGREIVLVPGNHDAALVRPWVRRLGTPLPVDAAMPPDATPALARIVGWLAPAAVHVHYPGVWLSSRVWATHGHYLDRHLLPESAFGVARGLLGRLPHDGATANDYEQGGPSLTRLEASLTRWLPLPPAALVDDVANYLRAATMPGRSDAPLGHLLSPLTSRILGAQMRRASMPALARVVHRLGVEADWVVFGHVHRLGPLPGDDASFWAGADGRLRIANTGSWVYEPLLLHHAVPPHPYWPGGAIVLEDEGDPQAVGLLDGLGAGARPARGGWARVSS
ncbi:MAG TPA: metallophosphoesterase [Baekduia sp.]|uniref:metallophosphoesterase n=1 Tax=Baekduia sp. TaxID=2600305 RepID=UPI002B835EE2|nr:metallophosphoesterase [Baekduia sp.]HMJ35573.1 metallophosphoesterase [Baekduia sp.]